MKIDIKDIAKIELDKDKEYIMVFSKKSGVRTADFDVIGKLIPNWKMTILVEDLDGLKVIEKQK